MHRRLASLVLPLCLTLAAHAQTPARPDSARFLAVRDAAFGPGLAPDPEALRREVRDPLFGFVFTMVEHDSLGSWTAGDLADFAATWGEESVFPLAEHLVSLTREPLPAGGVLRESGAACRRRWVIHLRPERLEIPMPYSILGYHPGKLSFAGPLVLHEWPLGARSVQVSVEGATRRFLATGLTVFQMSGGWILLDVDAWLDALLGDAADDALMQGFAVAWVDGELVGISNSADRRGRRILGELDFRTGEVAPNGRPLARGLAADARAWTGMPGTLVRDLWSRYDG
ncbi:MAG: hypothetical protein R3D98_06820 [Candidatus Krumholzibacteriia bacterium]